MPAKRVQMRKIARVLELHFVANLSNRAIARSVGVSRASVARLLERAAVAKLTWPLPEQITDAELEAILYPTTGQGGAAQRPVPNWAEVRQELARHRSLTLHQLWKEYIAAHPPVQSLLRVISQVAFITGGSCDALDAQSRGALVRGLLG